MEKGAENITIAPRAESDALSIADSCGFGPYVEALGRFLSDSDGAATLTVSIEGAWGSGKSSFMAQLKELLESRYAARCVWFNAWRSHGVDDLIPAFSRAFLVGLSKGAGFFGRRLASLKLYFLRYSWKDGGPVYFVRSLFAWFAWIALAIIACLAILNRREALESGILSVLGASSEKGSGSLAEAIARIFFGGSAASALVAWAALFRKLKPFIGSPFEVKLSKYSKAPSFASRYSLVEEFEGDFRKIVRAFAGDGRVYCFIDDIDRCDQAEIASLLGAMNQLIVGDPRVVFIVGMDSEKIAAALALRYKDIVPYLDSDYSGEKDGDLQGRRTAGRAKALGREFIEKFIQVPFRVPAPDGDRVRLYIDSIAEPEQQKAGRGSSGRRSASAEAEFSLSLGKDSEAIRGICGELSPFLGGNPRRIKRFINILRLQLYVGYETGLFDRTESGRVLELPQVAKALVVLLEWPELLASEDGPRLLRALQRKSVSPDDADPFLRPAVEFWSREPRLMALLRHGVDAQSLESSSYSLYAVEVGRILTVSERVRRLSGESGQGSVNSAGETGIDNERYDEFAAVMGNPNAVMGNMVAGRSRTLDAPDGLGPEVSYRREAETRQMKK